MTKHSVVALKSIGRNGAYFAVRIEPGKYHGEFPSTRSHCFIASTESIGDLWHVELPKGLAILLDNYDSYLHDYIKSAIATALITNTLQEVTFEHEDTLV